ncbi:superoxide dismutase family protein [Telmatospirillum sp. J64-1]|uniref:superoxide dismutase family protein n=1 Tax=Telmatospirillum sp. J64-1 TaxID=2502183 RepID=UPI00115C562C|nr:superoxide dismutase family protein [Telmatospirillum sp. J64-1]
MSRNPWLAVLVTGMAAGLAVPAAAQEGDPAAGETVFRRCMACHTLEEGQHRVGPSLAGVFGREAGAVEGFNYSPAMRDADIVWDEETIDAYLADPRGYIPGNRMAFAAMKNEQQRRDVIAYLRQEAGGEGAEAPAEQETAPEVGESPAGEGAAAEPGQEVAQAPADDQEAAASDQPDMIVPMRTGDGTPLGNVALIDTPSGLLLQVRLIDLQPGEYGFHIHETGRCDPPDFQTAGAHFNPTGAEHGFKREQYHLGDLPNLIVAEGGHAYADLFAYGVSLAGGEYPLRDGDGAALMIHAGPDDYFTDPSGHSGDRIACGVIEPGTQ